MIQFTEREIERIRSRAKARPEVMEKLKGEVKEVFEGELLVPKTGIANWTLYYYCPDCSVQLIFDRNEPMSHECPCCHKRLSGEPYDSSWWGLVNARNYNAAFHMAILWLASGETAYGRKAADILAEYARHYPDYEVHGDIPYNGPGRSGAQTLDEANFQRTLAMTYDIVSEIMSQEERELVRDNMLLPGAEFLLEHRHRQLHNHEVIINSAIAVAGILFDREDYVKAALYEDYGILYQLERGMLPNRMWFEGAFGYHFYALTSFFAFEKFALHTKYSQIHHPNYRAMMELPFEYLEPDMAVPMLNDTNYGHANGMKELYEFAYRELGGEKLAFILNTAYEGKERDNLEAFLYGADVIETPKGLEFSDYHTPVGAFGHTILRGPEGRYLLFKHDSYGGEHDHYDRLGISWLACGKRVAPDLGTTGYGARLHYDYYKNTGSHNTMVIGEENQAPVNGRLTRYEERDGVIYVEAEADWTAPFAMPDSFTIVQWKEEYYRPVTMRRKLAWTGRYFAEVFVADGIPEGLSADWVLHLSGKRVEGDGLSPVLEAEDKGAAFSEKKPFRHLIKEGTEAGTGDRFHLRYRDGEVFTDLYGLKNGQETWLLTGPDNPSAGTIPYIVERRFGSRAVCAHVVDTWTGSPNVEAAKISETREGIAFSIREKGGAVREIAIPV